MKILPTPAVPREPNTLLQISRNAASLPPLSVGEVVEAEIMEGSRHGKALILLKGSSVAVDSHVPLMKGERVTVRVAQIDPGVILRIVQGGIMEKAGLLDHLRLFRAHPDSLANFLLEGSSRFNPDRLGELAPHMGRKDVTTLHHLFRSLLFSGESLKNPLFLRDYVNTLGYLMEHTLGETGKGKSSRAQYRADPNRNLKALLLRMGDRLTPLLETGNSPAAEKLAGFVRSSLEAINSHQVVNYLLQEYEGKYQFQIPLLFPGKSGTAEIFIEFGDRDSREGRRQGDKNVLFLLDMDALGTIIAEATIADNKIGCVLKCTDSTVGRFIEPFLQELEAGLAAQGYDVEYLRCVVDHRDTSEIKEKSSRELQNLFSLDGIDLLA